MSGLEILGAVAASLQLVDVCLAVAQHLRNLPADGKMTDNIAFNCHRLLECISASLVSSRPESYRPARDIAEELQAIRAAIEQRKRKRLLPNVDSGKEYQRRLLMALNSYHCAITFVSHAMHRKLLINQGGLSRQLDQSFQRLMSRPMK